MTLARAEAERSTSTAAAGRLPAGSRKPLECPPSYVAGLQPVATGDEVKVYRKGSDGVIILDQIKGQLPALQVMLKEAGESL